MPIYIQDIPDPLSPGLSGISPELFPAESSALIFLYQEMRRYCQGQVSGRSFLISGHRGAGKTTLISSAFRKVQQEADQEVGLLRPLLVPMNGMAILPPLAQEPALPLSPETWVPGTYNPEPTASRAQKEAQGALEQITLCLYRAFAKEVAQEFWYRQAAGPSSNGRKRRQLELAAQLESELHQAQAPEPARLRELWRRGGLLGSTGLFPTAPWLIPRGRYMGWSVPGPGQGLRELVALASAADAFRRISGKETRENKMHDVAEERREAAAGLQTTGKDLHDLLLILLTGGLVGTGALAADANPVPAALAGLASALATSAFFKIARSSSRMSARSLESTFLADLTIQTLDRALPILIQRLLDAGLAPIFVVDELDKVQDLPQRMGGLVHHLKKLVAEQAFFCFLTDRDYFEEVRWQGTKAAYSVEYTYFTHQLYVIYSARQLHLFLDQILVIPELPRPNTPAASTTLPSPAEEEAERERSQELADYPLLSYLLLYRSKMHMLDLRRDLARLTGDLGTVVLPLGQVRSDPYRLEIFYQIALEMVLSQDEITRRIEQSPEFIRLVHDALYYPARRWEEDQDLDFGPQGRELFKTHLFERAGLISKKRLLLTLCSEEDLEVLFNGACTLAIRLASWEIFWPEFLDWSTSLRLNSVIGEVLGALIQVREPPLHRIGETFQFEWRYSPLGEARGVKSGLAASGPSVQKFMLPTGWDDETQFIEDVASFLNELSGTKNSIQIDFTTLSTQLRILSTSPAWTEARRAITALRRASLEKRNYREAAQDISTVREFAQLLRKNSRLLALTLIWGARIGRASNHESSAARLLVGLRVLSTCHNFAEKSTDDINKIINGLDNQIPPEFDLAPTGTPPELTTAASVESWSRWIQGKLQEVESIYLGPANLRAWEEYSWNAWRVRLYFFVDQMKFDPPNLSELFCAAAGMGPTQILDFRLSTMTIVAWSKVLLVSLLGPTAKEVASSAPEWLAPFALFVLGFDYKKFDYQKFRLSSTERGLLPPDATRSNCSVVLLRQFVDSRIEAWLPSRNCAAFSISEEQADNISSGLIGQLMQALAPDWLIVEEGVHQRYIELLKSSSKRGPLMILRGPLIGPRPDGSIVVPKNLRDLAAYLLSLPSDFPGTPLASTGAPATGSQ